MRSFSEHLFYRAPLRNCLFHVQVAVFQPVDAVKNYFTDGFQALYTRTREVVIRRRSFTENPWKLSVKRLISNEVARCQPVSLRKKVSHILLHVFCLHSLRTHHDYFFRKRLWNCASKISFRKYKQKVVLLVIYLFNYSSSKSTSFMLNVAFDFVLVRFSSSKLEFIAIQRLQKHSSFLIVCVLISSTI